MRLQGAIAAGSCVSLPLPAEMEAASTRRLMGQVAEEDCLLIFKTLLLSTQTCKPLYLFIYLFIPHPTTCC